MRNVPSSSRPQYTVGLPSHLMVILVSGLARSLSTLMALLAPLVSVNTRSSRWLNSLPTFLAGGASSSNSSSQNLILQY